VCGIQGQNKGNTESSLGGGRAKKDDSAHSGYCPVIGEKIKGRTRGGGKEEKTFTDYGKVKGQGEKGSVKNCPEVPSTLEREKPGVHTALPLRE